MSYNIEEFKNLVTRGSGFARTNMYRVIFTPENSAKEINLLCTSVDMPGRQILSNPRQIGLNSKEIAYGYGVAEVNMTFYALNDMYSRIFFEEWQRTIVNTEKYEIGYYNDYVKNVTIQALKVGTTVQSILNSGGNEPAVFKTEQNRQALTAEDVVTYSLVLENAYPKSIGPMTFSQGANELVTFTVVLTYKNWTSVAGKGGSGTTTYEQGITRRAFGTT